MGNCSDVRRELERIGLLMLQDKKLPSVVGIITGESLSSSWWSHKRGQDIFNCLSSIEDVAIATRLVAGKVTFVHRRMWPALLGVAMSRSPWQMPPANAKTKDLQERLTVFAEDVHTQGGRHEMRLQPWSALVRRFAVRKKSLAAGLKELEAAAEALGAPLTSLPWHRFREL